MIDTATVSVQRHAPQAPWSAGCRCWCAVRLPNDAGVVLRALGSESAPVRRRIREFWGVVRQQVLGVPVPDAFLWE